MSVIEKILIGACGGLCAVMVKFLGQDFDLIVQNAAILSADQILSYKIGYGILTPILMFLGAILAWVTDEKKRIKLFAIGVAAPAIITTYSGGVKLADGTSETQLQREKIEFSLITAVHAEATKSMPQDSLLQMQEQRSEKTAAQQITDGVKIFFGYGKTIKRYWVIVGSYEDEITAQKMVDSINTRDPVLDAFVGIRNASGIYPVIVGGASPLIEREAYQIKRKALELDIISEAFLSKSSW